MVALEWSMKNLYGIEPGECWWAASDIGWVVGHSYIVYAPLFHGCTTILYEGKPVGTPDAGAFWRVISEHKAVSMFTAPTAFRAIKKEDPQGSHIAKYDLSRFRTLFLAGERCDPDTLLWARERLQVPVIDHWWQTETGWPMAANCVGLGMLPVKPGSPTKAVPGYDVRVLGDDNQEMPPGQIGSILVTDLLNPAREWPPEPGGRKMAIIQQTLDYVVREMQGTDGGYFSATDADSEGVEGKFFVWTPDQVVEVLGQPAAEWFCLHYDITPEGNWEDVSIPNTPRPLQSVAADLGAVQCSVNVCDQRSIGDQVAAASRRHDNRRGRSVDAPPCPACAVPDRNAHVGRRRRAAARRDGAVAGHRRHSGCGSQGGRAGRSCAGCRRQAGREIGREGAREGARRQEEGRTDRAPPRLFRRLRPVGRRQLGRLLAVRQFPRVLSLSRQASAPAI
jgi:hypothetical protein